MVTYRGNISDLIDTQWNVNNVIRGSTHLLNPDLIDTQWNVNFKTMSVFGVQAVDLIDTQWNVNQIARQAYKPIYYGFNRYIVECKQPLTYQLRSSTVRFNRYIVECKSVYHSGYAGSYRDLIDTQWNVNLCTHFLTVVLITI